MDMTETPQPTAWIIQHCSVCEVVAIRVKAGEQEDKPVCKWCRAKANHGCPFAAYPHHVLHESAA
jgi:formylmethanofuran dehydrogenase subunit E